MELKVPEEMKPGLIEKFTQAVELDLFTADEAYAVLELITRALERSKAELMEEYLEAAVGMDGEVPDGDEAAEE